MIDTKKQLLRRQESKEGIYRIIGDGLLRHPELITRTDDEGFHRVVNGTYAYIKVSPLPNFFVKQQLPNPFEELIP